MDRETARRLIEALRRGDKQLLADYYLAKAQEWRADCQHCKHRTWPLARRFDFDALTVSFDCSLCGKRSQVALAKWTGAGPAGPLQPPPAS